MGSCTRARSHVATLLGEGGPGLGGINGRWAPGVPVRVDTRATCEVMLRGLGVSICPYANGESWASIARQSPLQKDYLHNWVPNDMFGLRDRGGDRDTDRDRVWTGQSV